MLWQWVESSEESATSALWGSDAPPPNDDWQRMVLFVGLSCCSENCNNGAPPNIMLQWQNWITSLKLADYPANTLNSLRCCDTCFFSWKTSWSMPHSKLFRHFVGRRQCVVANIIRIKNVVFSSKRSTSTNVEPKRCHWTRCGRHFQSNWRKSGLSGGIHSQHWDSDNISTLDGTFFSNNKRHGNGSEHERDEQGEMTDCRPRNSKSRTNK